MCLDFLTAGYLQVDHLIGDDWMFVPMQVLNVGSARNKNFIYLSRATSIYKIIYGNVLSLLVN
jgi:hypothetical protein